ncbi:hypothetical protein ACF1G3_38210 [Streptomyces rochei]|uniref:hypothetical protein n=1 Tax=Streptomyces rochei TaxID=1928 RepID=UPI0036F57D5F
MAEERVEIVVTGSGAGGAPLTHTLVRAGHQVVMLEKGPLLRTQVQSPDGLSDFKRDESFATGAEKRITVQGVANTGEAYFSSHVEPDLNDEPHVYRDSDGQDRVTIEGYTAQVAGGGTQLYGGVSPRFTPDDLRLRSFNEGRGDLRDDPGGEVRREARDWPVDYATLEPYYGKAEELVGIKGTWAGQAKTPSADHCQPPLEPNPISAYAAVGMDALGMLRYRTPLAVITRDHAPSSRTVPQDRESIKTAFVNLVRGPAGSEVQHLGLPPCASERLRLRTARQLLCHAPGGGGLQGHQGLPGSGRPGPYDLRGHRRRRVLAAGRCRRGL